jgi:hypothetical protein
MVYSEASVADEAEVAPLPEQEVATGVATPDGHPDPLPETFRDRGTLTVTDTKETPDSQQLTPQQKVQKWIEENRADLSAARAGRSEAVQAEIAKRQEEAQTREPLLRGLEAEASQPTEPMPAPAQFPVPPEQRIIEPEKFKSFFGPALVFSLLLGRVAKADMVDGLNMLSSAIQGYIGGRKEKFQHDYGIFKQKFEAAQATERDKIERYRAIMENKKYNLQQKKQLLEIEAYRQEDRRMQFALLSGDYDAQIKALEAEEKMLGSMNSSYDRLTAALETNATRIDVANINANAKLEAARLLASIRRDAQHMRGKMDAAKATQWYQAKMQAIEQNFARSVQAVATKAGTNKDLILTTVQMQAEIAAENMATLNDSFRALPIPGHTMTLQAGAELMTDPNFWFAKARGFEGLNKYIPPVNMPQVTYPPTGKSAALPAVKKGGETAETIETMPDGTPVIPDQ